MTSSHSAAAAAAVVGCCCLFLLQFPCNLFARFDSLHRFLFFYLCHVIERKTRGNWRRLKKHDEEAKGEQRRRVRRESQSVRWKLEIKYFLKFLASDELVIKTMGDFSEGICAQLNAIQSEGSTNVIGPYGICTRFWCWLIFVALLLYAFWFNCS